MKEFTVTVVNNKAIIQGDFTTEERKKILIAIKEYKLKQFLSNDK